MPAGACFNEKRTHRYMLWRNWDWGRPVMVAVLLNPSIANEYELDPTLTRVQDFARRWGFGGMRILNAFSLVATYPEALHAAQLRSAENDAHIAGAIAQAQRVMVGWGTNLEHRNLAWRVPEIRALLARSSAEVLAWKLTKNGHPSHPLYLRADIVPVPYPLSV